MKYYSDIFRKLFDTEEELNKAEADYKAKKEQEVAEKERLSKERATRAKEIEDAYIALNDAKQHYLELRNKFIKDFGSYHVSYTTKTPTGALNDMIDLFFGL